MLNKKIFLFAFLSFSPLLPQLHAMDKEENHFVIARNNINYAFQGKNLSGLTILDIGTDTGYNAAAMKEKGAIVYAIEPDKNSLEKAVQKGFILKAQAYHAKIEDFSEEETTQTLKNLGYWNIDWEQHYEDFRKIPELGAEFDGKFDVLTAFMIAFDEDGAAKKLAALLKPQGTLIIGYATPHEYTTNHSRKVLQDYFDVTSIVELEKQSPLEHEGFQHTQVIKGPQSSNAVYVTFKKKLATYFNDARTLLESD